MNPAAESIIILDPARPRSAPFLSTSQIRKSFDAKEVLAGIDLAVEAGEIVAIVGRSGCGKSTLLRLVAGLDQPTAGQILVNGQPLIGINSSARLMFQDACLLPWRTVLQNVALAAPRHDLEIARRALIAVGLESRGADWPAILSGGQRQRVALARALASGAPLLLLDEPLGALDALTKLEMQALIESVWREKQISILLITHDVEESVALADRVLVMESGRFIFETAVELPRPRNRSHPRFIEIKDQILAQVLDH
jgi:sulfonate transport system ATP-binding protein